MSPAEDSLLQLAELLVEQVVGLVDQAQGDVRHYRPRPCYREPADIIELQLGIAPEPADIPRLTAQAAARFGRWK